jgi:hypothetical protein
LKGIDLSVTKLVSKLSSRIHMHTYSVLQSATNNDKMTFTTFKQSWHPEVPATPGELYVLHILRKKRWIGPTEETEGKNTCHLTPHH